MWTLLIVMVSTVGIQHPIQLHGPPTYTDLATCRQAGADVVNWLTQDYVQVTYQCQEG